jgi:DNA polymerase I-like protein with 3'-5' exonuclease and polymerase domains
MAINAGCTIKESEDFQKRWFGEHPLILEWHERVKSQVYSTRTVFNKFGYRRQFFERIEQVLPEALAWIPQSTVACVINRGLVAIDEQLPEVQMLIQVHDSVVGQFPSDRLDLVESIRERLRIVIPYDDPLIIPVNIKFSNTSWGECS